MDICLSGRCKSSGAQPVDADMKRDLVRRTIPLQIKNDAHATLGSKIGLQQNAKNSPLQTQSKNNSTNT